MRWMNKINILDSWMGRARVYNIHYYGNYSFDINQQTSLGFWIKRQLLYPVLGCGLMRLVAVVEDEINDIRRTK